MKQKSSKDDYEIIKQIGRGSYGRVQSCYKKSDQNKTKLVMKSIQKNENYKEQEIVEYLMNSNLKHENLVNIVDIFEEENLVYFIMEHCDTNLQEVLEKKTQPFTQEEALKIIRQVTLGYQQCFLNKIIHRDLKPANILIKGDVYKLADFGESKIVKDIEMFLHQTNRGTPVYQSPQLIQGELKVKATNKIDIYSLGIIFYQLLTLKLPFKPSIQGIYNFCSEIAKKPFDIKQSIPTLNPDLADLINKMLRFSEEDRIGWFDFFKHPLIDSIQTKKQISIIRMSVKGNQQTQKKPQKLQTTLKTDIEYTQYIIRSQQKIEKEQTDIFLERLRKKKNENVQIQFFQDIPDSNDVLILKQYFQKNKYKLIQHFPYNEQMHYSVEYLFILVGILNLIDGQPISDNNQNEQSQRFQLKLKNYSS